MIPDTGVNAGARALARCALLTPAGTGAVAAIRVCGWGAREVVRSCLRGRTGQRPKRIDDVGLWFGQFCDGRDALDDVLVAVRPLAASGSVVDITCHGGVRIVERILLSLASQGAAVVPAGELGDAAVAGGSAVDRDVEAILPLCSTLRGAKCILRQRVLLTAELERIAGLAEGGCDEEARVAILALLDRGQISRAFHDPPSIVLIGPVNAGKSSLANRLAGREHAIVSDRAGTTRDWVTMDADMDGVPVTLIDTPGRATDPDDLEREAISRAERMAREARIRVLVLDATRMNLIDPGGWLDQPDQPVAITVINKLDKASPPVAAVETLAASPHVVRASALTGQGVSAVQAAVVGCLGFTEGFDNHPTAFGPMVQAGLAEILAVGTPLPSAAAAEIRRLAAREGA